MKKISRRIKRTLALVLAAVMVLSTDAPFTLLEAMVANAEELVPDREKMPEVASETEADDPDEDDNSGDNDGGQPPADNGQDGDDDSNVIVDNNINDDMLVASKGQLLSAKKQTRANEYLVPSDEYTTLQDVFDTIEKSNATSATVILTEDVEFNDGLFGVKDKKITYRSEGDNCYLINIDFGSDSDYKYGAFTYFMLNGDTVFDNVELDPASSLTYILSACGHYLELTENCVGSFGYIIGNSPIQDEIESVDLILNGASSLLVSGAMLVDGMKIDKCKVNNVNISVDGHGTLAMVGAYNILDNDCDRLTITENLDIDLNSNIIQIQGTQSATVGSIKFDLGDENSNNNDIKINQVYVTSESIVKDIVINVYDNVEISKISAGHSGYITLNSSSEITSAKINIYGGSIYGISTAAFVNDSNHEAKSNITGDKNQPDNVAVNVVVNDGEVELIQMYSIPVENDDLSIKSEIFGDSVLEIKGGSVGQVYLSGDRTIINGDSILKITGGTVTSLIQGIMDEFKDDNSTEIVTGETQVIFDGCGSASKDVLNDAFTPVSIINEVDSIVLKNNARVGFNGLDDESYATYTGDLIVESGSAFSANSGIVFALTLLNFEKGSSIIFAGTQTDGSPVNVTDSYIGTYGNLNGKADIYIAESYEWDHQSDIIEGYTIAEHIIDNMILLASFGGTNESAEYGNMSINFKLDSNVEGKVIQYTTYDDEGIDNLWKIIDGVSYTIEYYLDDVKIDDISDIQDLVSGGTGLYGEITLDPPVHITKDGTRYTLDKDKTDLTPELSDTDQVFKVYYATDVNGDDVPDYKQAYVRFDLGEDPFDAEFTDISATNIVASENHIDVWYTVDASPVYIPVPTTDKDAFLEGWFDGDVEYSSIVGDTVELTPGSSRTFTARWMSGDEIKLTPYDTTIYVGGSSDLNSSGFPGLELRVDAISDSGEAVSRPVIEENVESIIIDGVAQPDADIDKYLRVMYIGADQEASLDDSEPGIYTAKVVLTDDVVKPATGISTYGLAREAQTEGIYDGDDPLAASHEIYINGRKAQIADAQLIVRHVSDTEAARTDAMYRDIFTEEGTVAADGALAVIPSTSVIYTNDPKDGRVVDSRDGIRLFVDELLSEGQDDSREDLLIAKANQAMGIDMTADEARTAGYHYVIRYMDLVDTKNGNAWVSSSEGTDVYLPYQTDTTKDTEFRVIHFEELHREYGITGPAVEEAIAASNAVIMDATNTDYGIKFHTDVEGFSPFALVWHESGSFGDDVPGTDDDDHESSAPVSVGSGSSSSNDTYFTVGVTGNWKHMDNVDINAELDEPVPAGADPISSPEWHRWKFFRSNGIMLYNQWAHIDNPFAVEGQPRTGWFYFDGTGLMRYGWYLDTRSGDWYYMHSKSDGMLGTMMTGWHYDESDGKWYYLDPATGAMATGWRQIDGKWYYFNPTPYGETWTLDHGTSVWRFNQSSVRPYGSMYQDEITPDGYRVGSDGAWIQ